MMIRRDYVIDSALYDLFEKYCALNPFVTRRTIIQNLIADKLNVELTDSGELSEKEFDKGLNALIDEVKLDLNED